MKTRLCLASLLSLLVAASAHGADQKGFDVSDSMQMTATVVALDPANRALTLQGESGSRAVVVAGPEVRNFAQIKVGDRVSMVYYVGVAAQVKPRGTPSMAATEHTTAERAPVGGQPSAGGARSLTTVVKIDSVDTSFNTVTFKKADGVTRTIAVEDPDARRFIRTLTPGDPVEITYTEATAVSVEPAKP